MRRCSNAADAVLLPHDFNANGVTPYQPGATPQVPDPTTSEG
ncbi:MAG: hypothetical protein O3C40_30055 [Planctomycetota bacterium]|nr:hypothetical protein [Planctomycetota bacterium]